LYQSKYIHYSIRKQFNYQTACYCFQWFKTRWKYPAELRRSRKVKVIYTELLGRSYTAIDGSIRPLALEDFNFIASYNALVRALQDVLPESARVGSVDKFHRQEAPICIISLCSSYGEYSSRRLAFILDHNRINIARSRTQCSAVVVADPRIATAVTGSIDEMMLLNVLCYLADM
jgi:uncharacterized protein